MSEKKLSTVKTTKTPKGAKLSGKVVRPGSSSSSVPKNKSGVESTKEGLSDEERRLEQFMRILGREVQISKFTITPFSVPDGSFSNSSSSMVPAVSVAPLTVSLSESKETLGGLFRLFGSNSSVNSSFSMSSLIGVYAGAYSIILLPDGSVHVEHTSDLDGYTPDLKDAGGIVLGGYIWNRMCFNMNIRKGNKANAVFPSDNDWVTLVVHTVTKQGPSILCYDFKFSESQELPGSKVRLLWYGALSRIMQARAERKLDTQPCVCDTRKIDPTEAQRRKEQAMQNRAEGQNSENGRSSSNIQHILFPPHMYKKQKVESKVVNPTSQSSSQLSSENALESTDSTITINNLGLTNTSSSRSTNVNTSTTHGNNTSTTNATNTSTIIDGNTNVTHYASSPTEALPTTTSTDASVITPRKALRESQISRDIRSKRDGVSQVKSVTLSKALGTLGTTDPSNTSYVTTNKVVGLLKEESIYEQHVDLVQEEPQSAAYAVPTCTDLPDDSSWAALAALDTTAYASKTTFSKIKTHLHGNQPTTARGGVNLVHWLYGEEPTETRAAELGRMTATVLRRVRGNPFTRPSEGVNARVRSVSVQSGADLSDLPNQLNSQSTPVFFDTQCFISLAMQPHTVEPGRAGQAGAATAQSYAQTSEKVLWRAIEEDAIVVSTRPVLAFNLSDAPVPLPTLPANLYSDATIGDGSLFTSSYVDLRTVFGIHVGALLPTDRPATVSLLHHLHSSMSPCVTSIQCASYADLAVLLISITSSILSFWGQLRESLQTNGVTSAVVQQLQYRGLGLSNLASSLLPCMLPNTASSYEAQTIPVNLPAPMCPVTITVDNRISSEAANADSIQGNNVLLFLAQNNTPLIQMVSEHTPAVLNVSPIMTRALHALTNSCLITNVINYSGFVQRWKIMQLLLTLGQPYIPDNIDLNLVGAIFIPSILPSLSFRYIPLSPSSLPSSTNLVHPYLTMYLQRGVRGSVVVPKKYIDSVNSVRTYPLQLQDDARTTSYDPVLRINNAIKSTNVNAVKCDLFACHDIKVIESEDPALHCSASKQQLEYSRLYTLLRHSTRVVSLVQNVHIFYEPCTINATKTEVEPCAPLASAEVPPEPANVEFGDFEATSVRVARKRTTGHTFKKRNNYGTLNEVLLRGVMEEQEKNRQEQEAKSGGSKSVHELTDEEAEQCRMYHKEAERQVEVYGAYVVEKKSKGFPVTAEDEAMMANLEKQRDAYRSAVMTLDEKSKKSKRETVSLASMIAQKAQERQARVAEKEKQTAAVVVVEEEDYVTTMAKRYEERMKAKAEREAREQEANDHDFKEEVEDVNASKDRHLTEEKIDAHPSANVAAIEDTILETSTIVVVPTTVSTPHSSPTSGHATTARRSPSMGVQLVDSVESSAVPFEVNISVISSHVDDYKGDDDVVDSGEILVEIEEDGVLQAGLDISADYHATIPDGCLLPPVSATEFLSMLCSAQVQVVNDTNTGFLWWHSPSDETTASIHSVFDRAGAQAVITELTPYPHVEEVQEEHKASPQSQFTANNTSLNMNLFGPMSEPILQGVAAVREQAVKNDQWIPLSAITAFAIDDAAHALTQSHQDTDRHTLVAPALDLLDMYGDTQPSYLSIVYNPTLLGKLDVLHVLPLAFDSRIARDTFLSALLAQFQSTMNHPTTLLSVPPVWNDVQSLKSLVSPSGHVLNHAMQTLAIQEGAIDNRVSAIQRCQHHNLLHAISLTKNVQDEDIHYHQVYTSQLVPSLLQQEPPIIEDIKHVQSYLTALIHALGTQVALPIPPFPFNWYSTTMSMPAQPVSVTKPVSKHSKTVVDYNSMADQNELESTVQSQYAALVEQYLAFIHVPSPLKVKPMQRNLTVPGIVTFNDQPMPQACKNNAVHALSVAAVLSPAPVSLGYSKNNVLPPCIITLQPALSGACIDTIHRLRPGKSSSLVVVYYLRTKIGGKELHSTSKHGVTKGLAVPAIVEDNVWLQDDYVYTMLGYSDCPQQTSSGKSDMTSTASDNSTAKNTHKEVVFVCSGQRDRVLPVHGSLSIPFDPAVSSCLVIAIHDAGIDKAQSPRTHLFDSIVPLRSLVNQAFATGIVTNHIQPSLKGAVRSRLKSATLYPYQCYNNDPTECELEALQVTEAGCSGRVSQKGNRVQGRPVVVGDVVAVGVHAPLLAPSLWRAEVACRDNMLAVNHPYMHLRKLLANDLHCDLNSVSSDRVNTLLGAQGHMNRDWVHGFFTVDEPEYRLANLAKTVELPPSVFVSQGSVLPAFGPQLVLRCAVTLANPLLATTKRVIAAMYQPSPLSPTKLTKPQLHALKIALSSATMTASMKTALVQPNQTVPTAYQRYLSSTKRAHSKEKAEHTYTVANIVSKQAKSLVPVLNGVGTRPKEQVLSAWRHHCKGTSLVDMVANLGDLFPSLVKLDTKDSSIVYKYGGGSASNNDKLVENDSRCQFCRKSVCSNCNICGCTVPVLPATVAMDSMERGVLATKYAYNSGAASLRKVRYDRSTESFVWTKVSSKEIKSLKTDSVDTERDIDRLVFGETAQCGCRSIRQRISNRSSDSTAVSTGGIAVDKIGGCVQGMYTYTLRKSKTSASVHPTMCLSIVQNKIEDVIQDICSGVQSKHQVARTSVVDPKLASHFEPIDREDALKKARIDRKKHSKGAPLVNAAGANAEPVFDIPLNVEPVIVKVNRSKNGESYTAKLDFTKTPEIPSINASFKPLSLSSLEKSVLVSYDARGLVFDLNQLVKSAIGSATSEDKRSLDISFETARECYLFAARVNAIVARVHWEHWYDQNVDVSCTELQELGVGVAPELVFHGKLEVTTDVPALEDGVLDHSRLTDSDESTVPEGPISFSRRNSRSSHQSLPMSNELMVDVDSVDISVSRSPLPSPSAHLAANESYREPSLSRHQKGPKEIPLSPHVLKNKNIDNDSVLPDTLSTEEGAKTD